MSKRIEQTIYRVQKRPGEFVVIHKRFLSDPRLGFAAKGILAYLLAKPDDWRVMTANLMTVSGDGRDRISRAVKQLESAGYFRKSGIRDRKTGRFSGSEYFVYETPQHTASDDQSTLFEIVKPVMVGQKRKPHLQRNSPEAGNPLTEKPHAGNPQAENPPLLRMNSPRTEKTNSVGGDGRVMSAAERLRESYRKEIRNG